jgi:motility quorum-sensing regulator/GCU-specific mRNA interferase toxin
MEKRTPHCKLTVVKKLIEAGKVRMTASAAANGEQLGFDTSRSYKHEMSRMRSG